MTNRVKADGERTTVCFPGDYCCVNWPSNIVVLLLNIVKHIVANIRLWHNNTGVNGELRIRLWTHCMCRSNKHNFNSSTWTFFLNKLFLSCFDATIEFAGHILLWLIGVFVVKLYPPPPSLYSAAIFDFFLFFCQMCCFPMRPWPVF